MKQTIFTDQINAAPMALSRGTMRSLLLTATLVIALRFIPAMAATPSSWSKGVPMLHPRTIFGTAVGADGKIYAVGGSSPLWPHTPVNWVESFDESANRWEAVASLPFACIPAVAADKQGNIWAFAGNTSLQYDPSGNQWLIHTNLPYSRSQATAVADHTGRIYVLGGSTATNTYSAAAEWFDPQTAVWTDLPPMHQARVNFAVLADSLDKIYAIGGSSGSGGGLNSVERYDPARPDLGWVLMNPMPIGRQVRGTVGKDGLFYLVGGYGSAYTARVDLYCPTNDAWSSYEPLLYAENNMGVVTGPSGRIYAIGGDANFTALQDVQYSEPPPLPFIRSITVSGTVVTVTWYGTGLLQQTTDLASPTNWTDVPGAMSSPASVTMGTNMNPLFFRVKN